MIAIRAGQIEDLAGLARIGEDSAIFMGEELDYFLSMAGEAVASSPEGGPTLRVATDEKGIAEGASFFTSEAMAQGVANLLFIGARTHARGRGVGRALLRDFEDWARGSSHRQAIIETGSDAQFEPAWRL